MKLQIIHKTDDQLLKRTGLQVVKVILDEIFNKWHFEIFDFVT